MIDLAKLITIVMTIGYAKAAREGVGCFPEGNVEFNHDDCSSFLMCNHQRYIKMLCPKLLRFDPTTKTCNLIDRVRIIYLYILQNNFNGILIGKPEKTDVRNSF